MHECRDSRCFFRELVCDTRHDQSKLLGCKVKVFWDGDFAWYPGVLEGYDPEDGKVSVRFEDDTEDKMDLTDPTERVRFFVGKGHIYRKEEPVAVGAQSSDEENAGKILDLPEDCDIESIDPCDSEPAPPASLSIEEGRVELEDCEMKAGDLVWCKVKGYPSWPCLLLQNKYREEECQATLLPRGCPYLPTAEKPFLVQFFGTSEYLLMKEIEVVPFENGLASKLFAKVCMCSMLSSMCFVA